MKISVSASELFDVATDKSDTIHVTDVDLKRITSVFGGFRSRTRTQWGNVRFEVTLPVSDELDRLLSLRQEPDIRAKFFMSEDVFQRYAKEHNEDPTAMNQYKGVCIVVRPSIAGGVQLWYESYIKGNL